MKFGPEQDPFPTPKPKRTPESSRKKKPPEKAIKVKKHQTREKATVAEAAAVDAAIEQVAEVKRAEAAAEVATAIAEVDKAIKAEEETADVDAAIAEVDKAKRAEEAEAERAAVTAVEEMKRRNLLGSLTTELRSRFDRNVSTALQGYTEFDIPKDGDCFIHSCVVVLLDLIKKNPDCEDRVANEFFDNHPDKQEFKYHVDIFNKTHFISDEAYKLIARHWKPKLAELIQNTLATDPELKVLLEQSWTPTSSEDQAVESYLSSVRGTGEYLGLETIRFVKLHIVSLGLNWSNEIGQACFNKHSEGDLARTMDEADYVAIQDKPYALVCKDRHWTAYIRRS